MSTPANACKVYQGVSWISLFSSFYPARLLAVQYRERRKCYNYIDPRLRRASIAALSWESLIELKLCEVLLIGRAFAGIDFAML